MHESLFLNLFFGVSRFEEWMVALLTPMPVPVARTDAPAAGGDAPAVGASLTRGASGVDHPLQGDSGPVSEQRDARQVLTPERLHTRYAKRISRQIRAVLGPDQEHDDLVQDVLVTVILRVGTVRNPACLDAWVNQVTLNTLKTVVRQRRLRRHASLEVVPEQQRPMFNHTFDEHDLATRAMGVVNRLPPPDRALLATYWFSPATLASMADAAGCSIITVRRKLTRALGRFERLARRDPALAPCFADATRRSFRALTDQPS
jgi:RNA polymerase sigma factor (sigma-70 family)